VGEKLQSSPPELPDPPELPEPEPPEPLEPEPPESSVPEGLGVASPPPDASGDGLAQRGSFLCSISLQRPEPPGLALCVRVGDGGDLLGLPILLEGTLTACVVVANDLAETKYAAIANSKGRTSAATTANATRRLFIARGYRPAG
jgi:hypothetical protein